MLPLVVCVMMPIHLGRIKTLPGIVEGNHYLSRASICAAVSRSPQFAPEEAIYSKVPRVEMTWKGRIDTMRRLFQPQERSRQRKWLWSIVTQVLHVSELANVWNLYEVENLPIPMIITRMMMKVTVTTDRDASVGLHCRYSVCRAYNFKLYLRSKQTNLSLLLYNLTSTQWAFP